MPLPKRKFIQRAPPLIGSRGLTLIELMVALTIGSFLLIGAVTVFMQSRSTFRVNESVGRLQENERFVLGIVQPDVRMASFFGLTSRGDQISGRAGATDPIGFVDVANDCGPNWSIDLATPLQGWNNQWSWSCSPYGQRAQGSDAFVVRRVAGEATTSLESGRLYVQSARIGGGRLFVGPAAPRPITAGGTATHELLVNGYYVSNNSTLDTPGNTVPSLRRKVLRGLRVVDEEVLPGVEDMQIELGIDTSLPGEEGRGSVSRFVEPDDPVLDSTSPAYAPEASVLAVRVWLRLRAEFPERGFTDTTVYSYADQQFTPSGAAAGYRRSLVSKTIFLRNARPAA